MIITIYKWTNLRHELINKTVDTPSFRFLFKYTYLFLTTKILDGLKHKWNLVNLSGENRKISLKHASKLMKMRIQNTYECENNLWWYTGTVINGTSQLSLNSIKLH